MVWVIVVGKEVVMWVVGDLMIGVLVIIVMYFCNGVVVIFYVVMLLFKLVDEKKLCLDDKLFRWFFDFLYVDWVMLG